MKFNSLLPPAPVAFKLVFAGVFLATSSLPALAQNATEPEDGEQTQQQIEDGARLQIFLDRANFSPGKIDGRPGEFTTQALALYRESQGSESAPAADSAAVDADTMPDVSDLDLASVDPVFIDYTVLEADVENVGEVPSEVADQAKLKALSYTSALEAIAEKFHADQGFIEELNDGKTDAIKVGDTLRVPNVEPFELAAIMKANEASANSEEEVDDTEKANDSEAEASVDADTDEKSTTSVLVNTSTNMLTVRENDKLVAAYPVTIGSGQTESPVGDWKITGIAKMPDFRYDESMLKEGVRSDDFHMLPPGPNNPVGVLWIQLNKTGIGLHGTKDPDSIGRSASAGCVRLANWDVVRLLERIEQGVPVKIE